MSYSFLESQAPKVIEISEAFTITDPDTGRVLSFTAGGSAGSDGNTTYATDLSYSLDAFLLLLNDPTGLDCSFNVSDDAYITKTRMVELFPLLGDNNTITGNINRFSGSQAQVFIDNSLNVGHVDVSGTLSVGNMTAERVLVSDSNGHISFTPHVTKQQIDQLSGINTTENIQAQLDGKEDTVLLTASRAIVSNSSGALAVSAVTSTELGHLGGVSSNIQSQLNNTISLGSITGGASTILTSDLTTDRAVISNGSGKVAVSTVTSTELGYLVGVTSNIQPQIDNKQYTITGGASTILASDLTTDRAVISNGSGKVAVSAVTSTELGYLDGVTSAIQPQIDNKQDSNLGSGTDVASRMLVTDSSGNIDVASGIYHDNGKLGIGVSSLSSHALDISGNVNIRGSLQFTGTTEITQLDTELKITDQLSISNEGTGPALIAHQSGSNDIVRFDQNNVTQFIVADGGKVGIGTSTPSHVLDVSGNTILRDDVVVTGNTGVKNTTPNYDLDVTGDINFTGTLYQNGAAFSGGGGGAFVTSGNNAYFDLSGNVGIGTTTPQHLLDISNGIISIKNGFSAANIIQHFDATTIKNNFSVGSITGEGIANNDFVVDSTNNSVKFLEDIFVKSTAVDLSKHVSYISDVSASNSQQHTSTRVCLKLMGRHLSTANTSGNIFTIQLLNADASDSLVDVIYEDSCDSDTLALTDDDFYPIICDVKQYITETVHNFKFRFQVSGTKVTNNFAFAMRDICICLDDSSSWYKNSVYKQNVLGGLAIGDSDAYVQHDLTSKQLLVEGGVAIGTTSVRGSLLLDVNGNMAVNAINTYGTLYMLNGNDIELSTTSNIKDYHESNYSSYAQSLLGSTNGPALATERFITTRAIVNSSETDSSPSAIVFGNGSASTSGLGTDQISLVTNGSTRLYVNSNGRIGIGTTSPESGKELHVNGDIKANSIDVTDIDATNIDATDIFATNISATDISATSIAVNKTSVASGYNLDVTGNVRATTFVATSDSRFKKNICHVENALDKICQLNGVQYQFKSSMEMTDTVDENDKNDSGDLENSEDLEKIHAGVIAQHVDSVIPEAVNKCDNNQWSVDYNAIVGYLIESVKSLKQENDSLRTQIQHINQKIDSRWV